MLIQLIKIFLEITDEITKDLVIKEIGKGKLNNFIILLD